MKAYSYSGTINITYLTGQGIRSRAIGPVVLTVSRGPVWLPCPVRSTACPPSLC